MKALKKQKMRLDPERDRPRVARGTARRAPTRRLPKKVAMRVIQVDGTIITINFTARTIVIK